MEKAMKESDNCTDCPYAHLCNIPKSRQGECKANSALSQNPRIFGYSPDEIAKKQGIDRLR